jgi:hypothetical protein
MPAILHRITEVAPGIGLALKDEVMSAYSSKVRSFGRQCGGFTWAALVGGSIALAACGGEQRRQQTGTAGDTAATSVATDTATPRADTTAARPDTSSMSAAKESTAAAPKESTTAAPKPGATAAQKPTPSAKPAQDTTRPTPGTGKPSQAAESTKAAPPQTAEAPLRDAYHQAPLDTVSQAVYNGWKQFNLNCARCHGEDALGTTIAPHLIVSLKPDGPINTKELFMQTVCAGRPEKGMPAWCALGLDMGKIADIYAYVKGRSDAKIHPGRPAVKSGG